VHKVVKASTKIVYSQYIISLNSAHTHTVYNWLCTRGEMKRYNGRCYTSSTTPVVVVL